MATQPNIDNDDRSRCLPADEMAAFDRTEGDREIRDERFINGVAGRCIHPGQDIESDDHRTPLLHTRGTSARLGEEAAWRALATRAEQPVDDDGLSGVEIAGERAGINGGRIEHVKRQIALGDRVWCFASTGSMTRRRTPVDASARATTHASPPLLPGPASTRTPASSRSRNRNAISAAAAAPARCMSARDGMPAAIADASRAADSELVTTRIMRRRSICGCAAYFCDVPTVRP